jgi:hypothetical protein
MVVGLPGVFARRLRGRRGAAISVGSAAFFPRHCTNPRIVKPIIAIFDRATSMRMPDKQPLTFNRAQAS